MDNQEQENKDSNMPPEPVGAIISQENHETEQTEGETDTQKVEGIKNDPESETEEKAPEETNKDIEQKPKKIKKKSTIVLVIVFLVLLVGGIVAFLLLSNNIKNNDQDFDGDREEKEQIEIGDKSEFVINGNGINNFDLAFLKLENNNKNIVYSPLSIKYALSMVKDGANGESRRQIEETLGTYSSKTYQNSSNLSLANAVFINSAQKDRIKEAYSKDLEANYRASVIFDDFFSPDAINSWISQKTFNQINNMLKKVDSIEDYLLLVNALAIDMEWVNKIHPEKGYTDSFAHEIYSNNITDYVERSSMKFGGSESNNADAVQIIATANKYNIIKELGEDGIRNKVQEEYNSWAEERKDVCSAEEIAKNVLDLNEYVDTLSKHYGYVKSSTDFYFNDNEDIKSFAKDLKTYDGTTLQYVGIMPKNQNLDDYIKNVSASDIAKTIDGLKGIELNNFKEGAITKITANIPLFSFDYGLELIDDLQKIGISDIFSEEDADLSNVTDDEKVFVKQVIHNANIDFSNEGIKASAATLVSIGKGAAGGPCDFSYNFEVPIEEIDLSFDDPFLFLIRDKESGEIWFTGSVYSPNSIPEYQNL